MTHAIPTQLQQGDSLDDAPSSCVILAHATPIDITGSCEFGVGPNVDGIEAVCVSQAGTSPVFTIGIDAFDQADGTWENLITSASITGAATTVVKVNPHIVALANVAATRLVRRRMRVTVTYTSGTATGSLIVHAA